MLNPADLAEYLLMENTQIYEKGKKKKKMMINTKPQTSGAANTHCRYPEKYKAKEKLTRIL